MKAYNFLRIGADLVNASDAADKKAREVEQAEAHRKQAESSTEANNALVELRRRQTGELDAKAAQEKEMRDLLGNMDPNDPKAVPLLLQNGNAEMANKVFQYQNQQKEQFLLGVDAFADEILALPPEKQAEAYKSRMEAMGKLNPAWQPYSVIPYDPEMLRAAQAQAKGLIAKKPPAGQKWIRLADGRWALANPDGTIDDPQGPVKQDKPSSSDANLAYRITRDKQEDARKAKELEADLKAAYDTYSGMPDKERRAARITNPKFADIEAKAKRYQNEFLNKSSASPGKQGVMQQATDYLNGADSQAEFNRRVKVLKGKGWTDDQLRKLGR